MFRVSKMGWPNLAVNDPTEKNRKKEVHISLMYIRKQFLRYSPHVHLI
jgi:hypothetical protein